MFIFKAEPEGNRMHVQAQVYEAEERSEEKEDNFPLFSLMHACSCNLEEV